MSVRDAVGRALALTLTVGTAVAATAGVRALEAQELSFEAYRDTVEPIFVRARGGYGPGVSACVTCHMHSATPLLLEDLEEGEGGDVYWTEEQSRRNYEIVAGLVVPGQPERSRLLMKPLAAAAGGAPFHVGGKFWQTQDDPEFRAIADWVRSASSPADLATLETTPPPLDFEFFRTCVQQVFLSKREGRMECVHCHGGGSRGFARTLPEGRSYWNLEESRQNFELIKRYVEPGHPERSRFLTHPLAPEAGGDHFHSGGRRWFSKDDAEWQMLAAWVRGERPRCLSY